MLGLSMEELLTKSTSNKDNIKEEEKEKPRASREQESGSLFDDFIMGSHQEPDLEIKRKKPIKVPQTASEGKIDLQDCSKMW